MSRLAKVRGAMDAQIAPWRVRWLALSVRDQRALALMLAAIAAAAIWWLLISPLATWKDRQVQRYTDEQESLAWMQANAQVARQVAGQLPAARGDEGQSLLAVVNASAREASLNLQRFEPDGEQRVRVTLEKASFTDVMRWVVDLERRHGIVVSNMTADNQGQPGIVNIRLALERPGT